MQSYIIFSSVKTVALFPSLNSWRALNSIKKLLHTLYFWILVTFLSYVIIFNNRRNVCLRTWCLVQWKTLPIFLIAPKIKRQTHDLKKLQKRDWHLETHCKFPKRNRIAWNVAATALLPYALYPLFGLAKEHSQTFPTLTFFDPFFTVKSRM